MKMIEIEGWALRALERVEKRERVEDTTVELKAEWPEPTKAARRLAGHANAARGEQILWLIGADEEKGIVGVKNEELSNWFSAVCSNFDGVTPTLQDLNVLFRDKTISALCFDTSRAPYLVRNPNYGKQPGAIQWEVPWREGTGTRSATRNDLILLLSPLVRMPKIEVRSGRVTALPSKNDEEITKLLIEISAYVVPIDDIQIVFPFHKCTVGICNESEFLASGTDVKLYSARARQRESARFSQAIRMMGARTAAAPQVSVQTGAEAIEATKEDIAIRSPGQIVLIANAVASPKVRECNELQLVVSFVEAVSEQRVSVSAVFGNRNVEEVRLSSKLQNPPVIGTKVVWRIENGQ